MKPIIGLFSKIDDDRMAAVKNQYSAAVEQAGGVPVLLPYVQDETTIAQFIELCDGIIFTGGADVDPARYHEPKSGVCGPIQRYRDELEFKAFAHVFRTQKPVLAICRGMQLVNVALGGTLYQDIPSQIPGALSHKQKGAKGEFEHDIEVLEDTPLHRLIGKTHMQVNSLHHQAVKRLGEGLEVMAKSSDGVIEAAYLPGERYFHAYQWHPECLLQAGEENQRIFEDFIGVCKRH